MIREFKVRNFMNFRDELVFSFANDKNYEFNRDVIENGIIRDSVIVGYNATGKSNLGWALLDITNHLTDNRNTRVPKKLYTNLYTNDPEAHFSYLFQFGEHTVTYIYDKEDIETINREILIIDDKEVIKSSDGTIFVDIPGAETLDIDKKSSKLSLVKYVYRNSIINTEDIYGQIFTEFMGFVDKMLMAASTDRRMYSGFSDKEGKLSNLICELENGVKGLEEFLNDMGIQYELLEREDTEGATIYCKVNGQEIPFVSMCSSGTMSLVFFYYWYKQVDEIKFLYLDEYDAFYHTDLSIKVLKKLIENHNIQVVVSSHNTDIISNELLRPDCYFFMDDNKLIPFYKKTNKALREAHNLQKMYKAGAFDGKN